MSAMPLEARLAHVEGTVVQMGDRLNGFDARFNNLDRKIDELSARIDAVDARLSARIDALADAMERRFSEMDRRFTWLMGLVIASILLPIVQHFVLR
jgi:hypothetical protein